MNVVELKRAGDKSLVIQGRMNNSEMIRLTNYCGEGWSVALSSCMPADFTKAYDQHRVVTAAFQLVKDYEDGKASVGEVHILGEDDTMKGLGER